VEEGYFEALKAWNQEVMGGGSEAECDSHKVGVSKEGFEE
jgi:hypothetical protein